MTSSLSPTLTVEMDSLHRRPAAKLTVEQFLPTWESRVSGLSAGKLEQYAHGHAACIASDGNGTGEDILFRARSGSFSNPQDGVLYVAIIKGETLDVPDTWDAQWVATAYTGLVHPAWATNDYYTTFGGSIAAVHHPGSSCFRVFFVNQSGQVQYADFDYTGQVVGSGVITTITVDAAVQLGACRPDELFLLRHELIEPGYASWHKPIFGAMLHRYYYSSGWLVDDSFLYHTHADGHALKDGPDFDAADTDIVNQWDKRPCGGMAVNEIDANTVIVTLGLTWWRRWGYDTHSQGLVSFMYHRDSGGIWRHNFESGVADYAEGLRTSFDVFARGSTVEGKQVIVWSRNDEPTDLEQTEASQRIPRLREVVYAVVHPTGRYLTQFQSLGPQDDLTAAAIVVINHAGNKSLYALGWRAVYQSPPAVFLCEVPESDRQNLELYAPGYTVRRDNQWGMTVNVPLADASIRFQSDMVVREGNLIRAYHGLINPDPATIPPHTTVYQPQAGEDDGFIDLSGGCTSGFVNFFLGNYYGEIYQPWIRFPIDLPHGATIVSAKLSLISGQVVGSNIQTKIYTDAAINPNNPASQEDYLSRGRSQNFVTWSHTNLNSSYLYYDSPDLTALIQERLDQPDWQSGYHILFLLTEDGSSAGRIAEYGYESGNRCPKLTIEWRPPTPDPVELVQIGQGYIDTTDPTLSVQGRTHKGKIVARADKTLLDTRAEGIEDILPQNVSYLPPDDPIKGVSRHNGYWSIEKAKWPELFFSGDYPNLVNKKVYELGSSMEAFTGGGQAGGGDTPPGVYGGGGKVWEVEPEKKGSFYSDLFWIAFTPMVDGAVQATVRMGDNLNYPDFEFTAKSGCPVAGHIVRSNGHIQRIDYSTQDCPSAPDGVWNRVAQESTMAMLVCHAVEIGKKYAFVWEANSDFAAGSHLEDQAGRYWNSLVFDAPDFGEAARPPDLSSTKGRNRFYLLLSDYDEDTPDWTKPADRVNDPAWQDHQRWLHRYVAGKSVQMIEDPAHPGSYIQKVGGCTATGLTVGKPADMKMQVLGGTIYCFYRPYTEPNKSKWRHALSYEAGRFGAGMFGAGGRGHSTIYWDVLWPGRDHLTQTRNVVDFWDINLTDGVEDKTMEENLREYAWQGLTETEFRTFVDQGSITVSNGQLYSGFNTPPGFTDPLRIENLSIDFDLTLDGDGGEAGVYFRAGNSVSPKSDCWSLGLVVNDTYKESDNTINCYAVLRRYQNGAEVEAERDYSPSALHLKPGAVLPVRITTRGTLYSVWVAGNYIGHFGSESDPTPETVKGGYFGLYALGANATFVNIRVPELFEIPASALLDVNQTMKEAMTKHIGQRKIKGMYRPDGKLLLSYFDWNDRGPIFRDSLKQNQYKLSDRIINVCHVEGAYTYGIYTSLPLLKRGRRFAQYHNPDLMQPEHCLHEAKMTVKEAAERTEQATFVGLPDLRLEPEDQSQIIVEQQGIDNDWLIDDLEINFDLQKPESNMQVSTRKVVEI